jgi:imidazole glycerol-phosphate synthase subunit HisF
MLRSRIIPILLIRDKGLVKTRQFKDDKYVGDPINAVKIFNEKEVDELTVLDIDATVKGNGPDYSQLKNIASESRMPLCYGGGISNAEQAAEIIALGFEKISLSAAALQRPALVQEVAERVGRQSVVVTIDVRKEGLLAHHNIYSHNGTKKHKINALDFAQEVAKLGAGEIVINSIDRDGMMQGYDLKFAKQMREHVSVPLCFLGGAGKKEHMSELIDAVGIVGAGAGSMFVFKGTYRAVLISYERP